jgi:hypothetical protein
MKIGFSGGGKNEGRDPHAFSCKGICATLDFGKRPKAPYGSHGNTNYDVGAKRCSVCEVWIWPPIAEKTIYCKCCGFKVRKSAMRRSKKARNGLKRIA